MRSLTLKLTLAFLVVGLAGVVLVATLVRQQTEREFDRFVTDRFQSEVIQEAADYYATNGGWTGAGSVLRRGRRSGPGGMGQPVVLLNTAGQVVETTPPGIEDDDLRPAGAAVPVEVDGEVVGYVQFVGDDAGDALRQSAEAAFLARVSRVILISAGGAALLALALGAALAQTISRPVRELTDGTKALAAGDLGHQVPVRTADEIGELARSFNTMSSDLQRSNQLRKQMTADIAHDLRTPLSVILGYSEALQDGKLPGTPETYGAMHLQAQHLNRLIDDLRTLSLADAGQLSLQRRPVQTRGLLEHTALANLPQAEARGIGLEVAGEGATVAVDPDRIVQVLGNLVGNALRHTPDGGRIVLATERRAGRVLLSVADSGPGIPADDLPYIFDRFYRGDKARAAEGASGLGLAIARSLIEAHGGQLTAENAPDGGARFTITLPVTKNELNTEGLGAHP